MFCNWFPTKVYSFHECLLTKFWLFALNISVCTNTEHQGNRYLAARNSASPPETFTQQLNTPGTVAILERVLSPNPGNFRGGPLWNRKSWDTNRAAWGDTDGNHKNVREFDLVFKISENT